MGTSHSHRREAACLCWMLYGLGGCLLGGGEATPIGQHGHGGRHTQNARGHILVTAGGGMSAL